MCGDAAKRSDRASLGDLIETYPCALTGEAVDSV